MGGSFEVVMRRATLEVAVKGDGSLSAEEGLFEGPVAATGGWNE